VGPSGRLEAGCVEATQDDLRDLRRGHFSKTGTTRTNATANNDPKPISSRTIEVNFIG
jgi:hypothetical protein